MWKANGLPTESDIPNLNVEILNYHRPLMGTFHAKLLIVDRQVALINSNNIQDRPNIEACIRLEGDIVNSVYDHALISWGNRLQPPLPCLTQPAPVAPSPAAFLSGDQSSLPSITVEKLKQLALNVRQRLHDEDTATEVEKERSLQSPITFHFGDVVDQMRRRDSFGTKAGVSPVRSPSADQRVDSDKAARNAGALWAQKVLGERFSHFQSAATGKDKPDTVLLLLRLRSKSRRLLALAAPQAFRRCRRGAHDERGPQAARLGRRCARGVWSRPEQLQKRRSGGASQSSPKDYPRFGRQHPHRRRRRGLRRAPRLAQIHRGRRGEPRRRRRTRRSHTAVDSTASPKPALSSLAGDDDTTSKDLASNGDAAAPLKIAVPAGESAPPAAAPPINTDILTTKPDADTNTAKHNKADEGVPVRWATATCTVARSRRSPSRRLPSA